MSEHPLDSYTKKHEFLVGIDSDGCAFDTMELKHKECFIPNIVKYFGLQSVSKYAREAAEFVNLYSQWRGINRFPALTMAIDLLKERPEVIARGVEINNLQGVRDWCERETKLGNPTLKVEVENNDDPDLKLALEWSLAVNETVDEIVEGVAPYPLVRESLQKLSESADMIVCSATPNDALNKEWSEHGIAQYVAAICGQEAGSKKESLSTVKGHGYAENHMLMMGDAPGDMKAAQAVNALFYPINPGHEEESWQRFHDEACEKFLNEEYQGAYEDSLIAEFQKLLPDTPPWK